MWLYVLVSLVQNAAQRQTRPAKRRAEHPGRRTPQQVLVPQHNGAQRASQEDWYHSRHCKYSNRRQRALTIVFLLRLSFHLIHCFPSSLDPGWPSRDWQSNCSFLRATFPRHPPNTVLYWIKKMFCFFCETWFVFSYSLDKKKEAHHVFRRIFCIKKQK